MGILPCSHGIHLSKDMSPKTNQEHERMRGIPYASAVMYAMLCTRPDIAYVVSVTSRYQFDLGEKHWSAVKTILKKSTFGFIFILNGAVNWKSSKQSTTADSITEVEYIAALEAAKEVV
ncbi:secreted RxLR effector protein 161-like [Pistacia vera]|uniref:secreted RxLR effector protein 161-like n=1 Tax=Pistacia vera TaxID=55513 RepID=UPI001263E3DE|nr:secreted RxLR effector protein 161-like [Pistacia vera]